MDLSLIVPMYNECENVAKLHRELLPVLEDILLNKFPLPEQIDSIEVIIVDDGSRDGTYERMLEDFDRLSIPGITIRFAKHENNLGLGAALRTGFSLAHGEVILTIDSDGTYHFCTIPQLLAKLERGIDIVTASPYHPKGNVVGVPASRLLLSRGSSFLYRLLVNWNVHTYTALYRAYRRRVIEENCFKADGFLAGTELMVKAMLRGTRVAEYPAILHKRAYGVSKAKIWRTIRAHLQFQALLILHRLGIKSLIETYKFTVVA
jgi:dolichol-phosphate mannosyltransferase